MNTRRLPVLIIGTITTLCLGLIYAWSLFVAPIESDLGFSRTQTSLIFTISMSFFSTGNLLGGIINKKKAPRFTLLLSSVLLLLGFTLSSRISSLAGIYISYGIIASLAVGLGYNSSVNVVTRWYKDKIGTASGVLMMGFGMGGMVLGGIATGLMGLYGWRQTFMVFGITFAIVMLISSFFLRLPKPSDRLPEASIKARNLAEKGLELAPTEMLKRPSFQLFFIWCALLVTCGLATVGNSATFASSLGAVESLAAIAAGTISISNGFGRIMFGSLFDIIGRKSSMLLDSALTVLGMTLLIFASLSGSMVLLFIGYVCTGLAYGGISAMSSAFANQFYGIKNFSINFSIVALAIIPGAILGPYIAASLVTNSGTYTSTFIVMLIVSSVALVVSRLIKKP